MFVCGKWVKQKPTQLRPKPFLVGGFDPFWKICSSKLGSFPHVGVHIKNPWNHQPKRFVCTTSKSLSFTTPALPKSHFTDPCVWPRKMRCKRDDPPMVVCGFIRLMEEILHQLIWRNYNTIYRFLYISGGARFLLWTVWGSRLTLLLGEKVAIGNRSFEFIQKLLNRLEATNHISRSKYVYIYISCF